MKIYILTVLLAVQAQCQVIGALARGEILEVARLYFPAAEEVADESPCVLTIETHVSPLSDRLLAVMSDRLFSSPEEIDELGLAMEAAGYNYIVLGFTDQNIVFDRFHEVWLVLDTAETVRFFEMTVNVCVPK